MDSLIDIMCPAHEQPHDLGEFKASLGKWWAETHMCKQEAD